MSSGTSILQSIIQAVDPKTKYQCGLWKATRVIAATSTGLVSMTRMVYIGYSTSLQLSIGASIEGEKVLSTKDLGAVLCPRYFEDIWACIHTRKPVDLSAFIISALIVYKSTSDLNSYISCIVDNLLASITPIEHQNLIGVLKPQRAGTDQYKATIRGWYRGDKDLNTIIQPHVEVGLEARIETVRPRDLSSYIKTWPYKNLSTNIYGWAVLNLFASIAAKGQEGLIANIGGHYPVNLRIIMRGVSVGNYNNISSNIIIWHVLDMSARLGCFNVDRVKLGAFIECRPLHLLNALIVGWAHKNLSATLTAKIPSYYLPATITVHGGYRNLNVNILGSLGTKQINNLYAMLSGWQHTNLLSLISSIKSVSLVANITSIGGAKDIKADIKVKEIIFSEFYKLSTANFSDLRAYVGFSLCTLRTPRSAYMSLMAAISSVPVYDLGATIEGIKTVFSGMRDLGVLINYTNKYSILFKFLSFKMSTSISDCIRINPAFSKNSLNITFKIINGQVDLNTSITAQLHNLSLGATISSKLLIIHGRSNDRVLTEEIVEIDVYKKRWSEYIDVYLNVEKPIYYAGGKVFSRNYGDPIFSFLFKRDSSVGIKHEYNLRHDLYFDSTDSAIRHGLLKISGRVGLSGLGAKIQPVVKNLKLIAKIKGLEKEPLYLDSPFTYLKFGSLLFMGTCVNHIMYKSKSNIFGGMQDIVCNIAAVPN